MSVAQLPLAERWQRRVSQKALKQKALKRLCGYFSQVPRYVRVAGREGSSSRSP
jgi:hypothetical protein